MRRRDFLGTGAATLIGGLALDRIGFDLRAALAQSSGVLPPEVPRHALVIGNGAYRQVPALSNPINDARSIAGALRECQFRVDYVENADLGTMHAAVSRFRSEVPVGCVALAYYAGHGVQYEGINYFLPVDVAIANPDDLVSGAVTLDAFLENVNAASAALGIFVVDACRENPFGELSGALGSGLATVQQSTGETFIAYAAAAGAVAYDGGAGTNSPFTSALVAALEYPDRDIFEVFREVRGRVREATEGRQLPWLSTSLERSFVFRPAESQPPAVQVSRDAISEETVLWQAISPSTDAQDFTKYLELFPDGEFVEEAKARIAALDTREFPALPRPVVEVSPAAHAGATPCDLVAADPFDPNRVGEGVINGLVNTRLAIRLCTEAVTKDPGNPRLEFQLGRVLSIREQWDEAEHYLVKAGEKGYPIALSARAGMYRLGYGRPQSFEFAAYLYGQAAQLGDTVGQFNLGKFYQEGWGVEQSYPNALAWYHKVASVNYPPALDSLGNMYKDGVGVPQNLEVAAGYYRRAAEHGSSNAMDNLAKLYREGEGVPEDFGEAVRLFNLAIERGNIFSPHQLGRMYRKGWGVEQNPHKAFELFQLSAERGFEGAWLQLGEMYESGEAGKQDLGEAYFHYLVAQMTALARRENDPTYVESQTRAEAMARRIPASIAREQERRAEQWVALNGASMRRARHAFQ
jgi:uncharacterized caspase-like protein/TPR repeat protein